MKKKILSGLFALALLATAGFGVNKSLKSDAGLSDLALSNVEALADRKPGGGYDCCNTCSGALCGTFVPDDGGASIKVYWK